MINPHLVSRDLIANKMKVNSNVLHPGMEDGVGAEIGSTNVVTINGSCSRDNNTKFEKMLDPIQFSSSSRNGSIFCLRGRAGNSLLLFGIPRDGFGTKKNNISGSGCSVIFITSLVIAGKAWRVWVVVGRRKRP